LFVFSIVQRTTMRDGGSYLRQVINMGVTVCVLVAWGVLGVGWVQENWIPVTLRWPVWIETIIEILSWIGKAWILTAMWRLWWEIVDPNGPTAPRAAVVRDKGIPPWDRETFGGTREQEPEPQPQLARVWKIDGTLHDANGHKYYTTFETQHAYEWHQFAKDLIRQRDKGKKPRFSYRGAGRWKVPAEEFEAVTDEWLRRGYARKTPSANNNGHIYPLRKGWVWIEGMAENMPEGTMYA